MKIFDWVHRRFNHKDEVGPDSTKAKVTGNGKDKLALLENAAFDGLFGGWKEGILAIGTLGFDPALLKNFEPEEDDMYFCDVGHTELSDNDGDDGVDDHEGEMEFPLVLKASKHGFFHDKKDDNNPQCDGIFKANDDDEDGVKDLSDLDTDQVKKAKKTGERITLADLFWADSEKNLLKNKLADEDHVKIHYHTTESNMKHALNDDRIALISKKKVTKDDSVRPIKKINRLVRKMLKKKIHPDVENQKETVRIRMKPIRIPGSVIKNTQ